MKSKKSFIISCIGILSILFITLGITYAFFNYAKTGTTENVISSGTLTFIYEEIDKQGSGISIENAYPTPDDKGKILSKANEVFNFKVKSNTSPTFSIPYTITARKTSDSYLNDEAVRIYLTEVNDNNETELLLDNYSKLPLTDFVDESITERILHSDIVPKDSVNYEKNYRLRMWIDSDVDFSPIKDENGNITYPYNNITFKLKINVYAEAEVVNVPTDTKTMTRETKLSIGESVTAIDGSKWHVLEASDENSETVTLLSDYNLNSDGTYNTSCGKDINSTYTCSSIAFDNDNTNIYDENDINNIGYFIKNTYSPLVTNALSGTTNVILPTAFQIATADNQTFSNANLTLNNTWLLTTNYWTKNNTSDATDVWVVDSSNHILVNGDAHNSGSIGARPVITTPKTNLLAK